MASAPQKFIKVNGVMKLNPEYKRWKHAENHAVPVPLNTDLIPSDMVGCVDLSLGSSILQSSQILDIPNDIDEFIGHSYATIDDIAKEIGVTSDELFGPDLLGDDCSLSEQQFEEIERRLFKPGRITMKLLHWFCLYPDLWYTAGQKLELLEKHKLEFPSKLRPVIDQNLDNNWRWRDNAEDAFPVIENNVKVFFFGRKVNGIGDLSDSLNSQVDTEEEVELLMRFFGFLQINRYTTSFFYSSILEMMSTEPQAQRFIPLYVRIWGVPYEGLGIPKAVLILLGGSDNDLDDENSDAFIGLECLLNDLNEPISRKHLEEIICCILRVGEKDVSLMQSRIRFMIRWRPSLLKSCRYSLVHLIVYSIKYSRFSFDREVVWELYRLVAELSLHYYPKDLGFIFHGEVFKAACDKWGEDRVRALVSDVIIKTLDWMEPSQQVTFVEIAFDVAINKYIHLDGLYTLLCINPVAIIPRLQRSEELKSKQNEQISKFG